MIRDVYQKCYERQAAFYRTRPRAKKMLTAGNYALTAAVFVAYALLCLIELIVRRKTATQADVIRIVAVPLLCLLAVSILRNLIDRKRPYETGGIFPVIAKRKRGIPFRAATSRPLSSSAWCCYPIASGRALPSSPRGLCSDTYVSRRAYTIPPICSRARGSASYSD